MKKNKFFFLLLAAGLLGTAGCKKSSFLDVNNSPNNPINVPPSVLLSNGILGTGFTNGNDLSRVAGLMVQHNAGTANQLVGYDIYNLDGNFDNSWDFEIYSNLVSDLRTLISKTEATSPAYAGIAKILLAYSFSVATDLWGDVPYSQAGKGLEFPTPRFDKQQDIYLGNAAEGIQSLFDLVKEGIADLDKTSLLRPGADDVAYAGNLASWKRAGNTMLLKLAMQIGGVDATKAKAVITEVINGNNYITSNTQDFEVPFGQTIGSQSPLYSFNMVNRVQDQMLSTRFLNLMNSLNDQTRLGLLYTRPNNVFTAYENGNVVTVPAQATRSRYNTFVVGPDAQGKSYQRILSNSQRAFILAEAALLLNTGGNANALYQEGIRAHMTKIGMTTAQIDAYFAANPGIVTLSGPSEQQQKQIITQKYISFVGNPIEAYNDYRRTGFPELQVALNSAGDDPTVIPKRLPYTPNERARNPNCPNPRPLMNVKVWWGK